jgi:hypothetical protein
VLLSDCPWYAHRWVEERQMLPGEGQSVRSHFANNPAAVFSRVAKRIHDKLKDPNYQPAKARVAWPALPPDRVDLTRLPETGAALFGREQELQLLDFVWISAEQGGSTPTQVLAFTANGGVGKSTLVNHWLRDMQRDHFRGATRVFGWSFYSQGTREEGMASADTFIDAAPRCTKPFWRVAQASSPYQDTGKMPVPPSCRQPTGSWTPPSPASAPPAIRSSSDVAFSPAPGCGFWRAPPARMPTSTKPSTSQSAAR